MADHSTLSSIRTGAIRGPPMELQQVIGFSFLGAGVVVERMLWRAGHHDPNILLFQTNILKKESNSSFSSEFVSLPKLEIHASLEGKKEWTVESNGILHFVPLLGLRPWCDWIHLHFQANCSGWNGSKVDSFGLVFQLSSFRSNWEEGLIFVELGL